MLEPQVWKSYGRKRLQTRTARDMMRGLVLRPDDFVEQLVELGFALEATSEARPDVDDAEGWARPIYTLRRL